MSFRLARLGRGLDEDEVLDFCARVESELARLLDERASLYAELRRLRGRTPGSNSRPVPLGAPVAAPDARPAVASRQAPEAVRILAKAQQTAERCVADAQAYSREVAHDAQRRREKILAEANARATLLLEQARRAVGRTAIEPSSSRDYSGPAGHSGTREYPAPGDYPAPREYPGSRDYSGVTDYPFDGAHDYPGPAADYPASTFGYSGEAIKRSRYRLRDDRFPC